MQDLIVTMTRSELERLLEDRVKFCLLTYIPVNPTPTAAPEPTTGQLLTKKEAAKLLACSTSSIDNAARAGRLPRHYIGKSVRFQKEDVLNLPMQKTPRPMGQPLLERKKRKG